MFAKKIFSVITYGLLMFTQITSHAEQLTFPPSAELLYSLKSTQKGVPVSGEAKVQWQVNKRDDQTKLYRLNSETKVAIFGKILVSSSHGSIQEFGLAPEQFQEKRFRRAEVNTYFDREQKIIRFSESDLQYPIQGGEQDRLSATWQLVGLVQKTGAQTKLGQEWKMFVAGSRDADPWTFKFSDFTKIRTALGELNVMHIIKAPPSDAQGQRIELWLALDMGFYPVQIRYQDHNGDVLEQKIISIKN